jgi:peptidoglycan/LPS O-acetylase OafA/YrhL
MSDAVRPAGIDGGRLIFAHQLRGIAALLILVTHYFGNFYGQPQLVAELTFSPAMPLQAAPWVRWFDFPYFKGPFGVALFFLISGFVIPFSLEKAGGWRFALMRFFRIYPTYVAALALSMAALACNALFWERPFTHTAGALLANALLVNNLVGTPTVDPINWTLAIEVRFYLVAALLGGWIFRRDFRATAAFALLLLGATALLARWPAAPELLKGLGLEWNYILFMLIGVGFYHHIQGAIGYPALGLRTLALLAIFSLNWWLSPQHDSYLVINVYYYYAVMVFGLCYLARGAFRPVRVLDFFADISYPLYAVHSLIGFALLKNLIVAGMPFQFAVVLVTGVVIALAWGLHVLVEVPSNGFGKRLALGKARDANSHR